MDLPYPRDFVTDTLDDIPELGSDPFAVGQWLHVKVKGKAIFGRVVAASLPEDGKVDRELGLPDQFAVKIIPRAQALGPDRGLENPRNEICAALAIKERSFEYVAQVYGVWQDEGNIYIASKLCCHDVMAETMGRAAANRFNAEADRVEPRCPQGGELVRQIVTGLRGLHRAGIVHRDLSLENCLVADDGTVRITDFGQAALVHDDGAQDEVPMVVDRRGPPGKRAYLAPEFMRAIVNKNITNFRYSAKKLDMYQLGVAAFTSMALSYPYNPEDTTLTPPKMTLVALSRIVGEHGLFPPCDDASGRCSRLGRRLEDLNCRDQVTDLCLDFLERAMAPNPELRLSADQALEHPWLAGCRGESTASWR